MNIALLILGSTVAIGGYLLFNDTLSKAATIPSAELGNRALIIGLIIAAGGAMIAAGIMLSWA